VCAAERAPITVALSPKPFRFSSAKAIWDGNFSGKSQAKSAAKFYRCPILGFDKTGDYGIIWLSLQCHLSYRVTKLALS
jgi:hypothetical protein